MPGRVDQNDSVLIAPHLQGLVGASMAKDLRAMLPRTRIWVGNDATAACWAEHRLGAGRGSSDMVMVTLGTGIGGGIVVGGRLVEGAGRFAGEIGHMVIDPAGPECPCGKRGCWERFASGSGLGSLGRDAALAGRIPVVVDLAGGDPAAVRGEHVTEAASAGYEPAREVLAVFARWVAMGLGNLATILDPEMFVIGGGLVEVGEPLMAPIRRMFTGFLFGGRVRPDVRLVPATLGARAGAVGAALLGATAGHQ